MEKIVREAMKRFCDGFSNPAVIMDRTFMCLYSNRPKLIPPDRSLAAVFTKTVVLPLKSTQTSSAAINGTGYCVRLMPLDEGLCICEFIEAAAVLEFAENTDIYGKLLPIVNELDYDSAALWRSCHILRSKLDAEESGAECALGIEKYLTRMSSVVGSVSEYVNIMFCASLDTAFIDINTLLEGLIGRCNTVLSDCGRYVDYVSEPGSVYIRSHQRYVICAAVNAIQNALLYSPRDCVPYVTLCREDPNEPCGNVILQIINDRALYNESGSDGEWNMNSQRLGFGIPIIKRFAELAGGSFSIGEENGKVRAVIKLPIAELPADRRGVCVLSSSHFVYYKTGIPDILELKMREINMLFAE